MAGTAKILNIERPQIPQVDASGISVGETDADYLLAYVDVYSNDRVVQSVSLAFADYAGLQTEWEAGTATTVLEAALTTALNAVTLGDNDSLTTAQKAVTGYSIAIA